MLTFTETNPPISSAIEYRLEPQIPPIEANPVTLDLESAVLPEKNVDHKSLL